jgi:hypothetical protein
MPLSLFRSIIWMALAALLTSCAVAVTYAPADIMPIPAMDQQIVALDKTIDIRLDTGYTRSLKAGSQWMRAGAIAQGDVYKPYRAVFTLEGAHVHEAWLVIADGQLSGFYLPVERGYSPLGQAISASLTSTPK